MLCIFDLDGTLVDSLEDLREATEYALFQLKLPGYPLDKYRLFVGDGVKMLLLRALGPKHTHLYKEARSYFDEYYAVHCLDHTDLYPYINQCIHHLTLKGIKVAVYTNKPDYLAKKIVNSLFDCEFTFIQGQTNLYPVKPDPSFLNDYFTTHHVDKEHCIFIGDSDVDIFTSNNVHIKSIGVTWGNREQLELEQAGATVIVHNVKDLENKIMEMAI